MNRRNLAYVDAEDFLRALNVRKISRSGDEINFSCPGTAHAHGDQRPSARMNAKSTRFLCHTCGIRGDAVTFLVAFHELTESEAQRVIDERYGGPGISIEVGGMMAEYERLSAQREPVEIVRTPPEEVYLGSMYFHIAWTEQHPSEPWERYMLDRGLTPETLADWWIGYDEISDRITIPVRDEDGKLIGFKGRSWNGKQPKYLIVGNAQGRSQRYTFDTYAKSQVVFALDRAQDDRAVIVEGELNAIMLHQHGEHGAVSVAGSEFSAKQAELIIRRFSSATVYFDADDAGRHGTRTVVAALEPYMPVRVVVDPPDDAAALGADAIPLIASAVPALTLAI